MEDIEISTMEDIEISTMEDIEISTMEDIEISTMEDIEISTMEQRKEQNKIVEPVSKLRVSYRWDTTVFQAFCI